MNMIAEQDPRLRGLYENIPAELKELPQWAVANHDKIPIDPKTGRNAKVGDRSTWGTFEEAITADYPLIGFMFSEADPYCVIDLDNKEANPASEEELARYQSMIENFDSYTERSTSGRGYHIVVKARLEQGRRRDKVEIYSSLRFMVFTGDVVKESAIQDRQHMVDHMVSQLEPVTAAAELEETKETLADKEVFETAMRASDGDKFDRLCRGEWQAEYESQSQADHALLCILAFYSRSNEQCRRLFRMSALGQRDKAQKDSYLNLSLSKFRAKQPPPVDMEQVAQLSAKAVEAANSSRLADSRRSDELAWPPGLIGDIAQYIFHTATLPVREVALVAALGLVAGISGRRFNTYTHAGLNLYLTLLGETGIGKEGGKQGIQRIKTELIKRGELGIASFEGPGNFASGQALVKRLQMQPCFYSIMGEFGHTMRRLTNPRASNSDTALQQAILDLYSSSGQSGQVSAMAYSDQEKTTSPVQAPSFTLVSESTPGVFYDCLDADLSATGFLARFVVVEYRGDRPDRNKATAGAPPESDLLDRINNLTQVVSNHDRRDTFISITPDQEAEQLLDAFDEECTDRIRGGSGVERELWNRAHLNALKIATLLAVGEQATTPVVIPAHARWAIDFIRRSVETILARFEKGEVGGSDSSKAEAVIRSKIDSFLAMKPKERARESLKISKAYQEGIIIPHSYLSPAVRNNQPFKNQSRLLKETLAELVKSGVLQKVKPPEGAKPQDCYAVGENY